YHQSINPAMKKFYYWLLVMPLLYSCSGEPDYVPIAEETHEDILNLPQTPYNYSDLNLPAYFLANDNGALPSSVNGIDNTPAGNAVTDNGATLGRVLFYDVSLSANRTTACGSCHRPEKAFADSSPFSHGLYGQPTRRNSITLVNSRFYKRGHFFYDERANTLEDQALMPVVDIREMDLTMEQITQRVQAQSYYPKLFKAAFGDSHVSNERIADALSQFMRSIVSFDSKYDAGRAQVANMVDDFPNFTIEENRGKALFLKSLDQGGLACYACHTTEAFVSPNIGPINNGLDLASTTDLGAFEHYPDKPNLKGAFKIPTLRNIALTGPYMHDGRFNTLMQVIEFYNSGVQNHAQLSPFLKGGDGLPRHLNLTQEDKIALLKFLYTLNGTTIFNDPRWLDPFINQHL
ncbi:MAG: cytochrome c peroxidase, partial [Bacteroidota bacterium]